LVFTTFAAILVHLKKKLKVGFWEFVARIVLKTSRYPWRYRSNNGFISTAMENIQFSLRKLTYCRTTIIQEYNAFLDKFGEEIVVELKTMLFTPNLPRGIN
jgi:hypothetical protein